MPASSRSPADAARASIAVPMASACRTTPIRAPMPVRAAITSARAAAAAATAARLLSRNFTASRARRAERPAVLHSHRRPRERASACTHLENRLKYRDLDDPRFWKCLHVGTAATIDKTRVFRRRRSLIKRCVHPLARTRGPITPMLIVATYEERPRPPPLSRPARRMGPCFRRDDEAWG